MLSLTVPPGLTIGEGYNEVICGEEKPWLSYGKVKFYTNAFIKQPGKILLGYKKRGFGKDLYNGFGGKLDPGETPAQAALRELEEEAGITAPLDHVGTLLFASSDSEHAFHIEIYSAETYSGTITESEEMRPQWFATTKETESAELLPIPYEKMWADDPFWMPLLLANRHFVGRVDFGPDGHLQQWWFAAKPAPS